LRHPSIRGEIADSCDDRKPLSVSSRTRTRPALRASMFVWNAMFVYRLRIFVIFTTNPFISSTISAYLHKTVAIFGDFFAAAERSARDSRCSR
jgi:hypothetical protein